MRFRASWRSRVGGAAVLAGATCALLAGCEAARPAALKLDVLAARPASAPLAATALFGEAGRAQPEATGGESDWLYLENRGRVRVEREQTHGAIIERRVLIGKPKAKGAPEEKGRAEGTPLVESRYRVTEEGALVLVEEINYEEDVEVVFDPPLVVLPPSLAPGETFKQSLTMTVHPLGDRSRVKARGPVKSRVTYEGRERIVIPAGEFDAAKVTTVFEAALNIARVTNTTEEWIAAGEENPAAAAPMLAERREEVTRVLVPSTKKRLMVLLERK